jgi:hypothetical protein
MVRIIRDRIQNMIDSKMTLAQIQADQPTLDYGPRYGSSTPSWSKDIFLKAISEDLAGKKAKMRSLGFAPNRSSGGQPRACLD